ncbi:hypothetical protein BO221_07260 [Archangium sp. Cb G35]|nr:hypothetical protein BO221_07260 [Archangium sp. Cb G35]
MAITLILLLPGACTPLQEDTLHGRNAPPVARPVLLGTTHLLHEPVTLDGSRSFDPEGALLTFSWSLVSRPPGSKKELLSTLARPSITPDVMGDYVIQLVVSDDTQESEPATVVLTTATANRRPQAHAVTEVSAVVDTALSLSGEGSDADWNRPTYFTYSWTLTRRPPGSTAVLSGADTATPTFTPDVAGDYQFVFTVSDGLDTSPPVTVTLTAHPPIHPLPHQVLDAEYSQTLDRLVMVSDNPNALYVYDPVTRTETAVALPKAPTSVSVGPDGLFAAVGHDALVSYVDLSTPTLLKTLPLSIAVFDLVLAGNGYAYAFPGKAPWEQAGRIHCIQLSTGVVTLSSGDRLSSDTQARLHTRGTSIYAGRGILKKYDISQGTARVSDASGSSTDHPACGDLWFSEDGSRIFTGCGNTFRASNAPSEDLTYAGSLPFYIRHLSHSTGAHRIALLSGSSAPDDTKVHFFTPDFLAPDRSVLLPPFMKEGKAYASHGRFVFFTAAGDQLLVILQTSLGSGMPDDYGLFTY